MTGGILGSLIVNICRNPSVCENFLDVKLPTPPRASS